MKRDRSGRVGWGFLAALFWLAAGHQCTTSGGAYVDARGESSGVSDMGVESRAEREDASLTLVSVMGYARLAATDPVLQGLFLWPREAEDSIASVRDGSEETWWKAPAGESYVEVDLGPWLQAPARLAEVRITWGDSSPGGVEVSVLRECGSSALVSRPWSDLSQPLQLGDIGGCLGLKFSSEEPFSVTALSVTAEVPSVLAVEPSPAAEERRSRDFAGSGVVEGFYGVPWSWAERRAMVLTLALNGMGTYIYAPKSDALHRHLWREPYPEETMARFEELALVAAQHQVALLVGLSPFVDWGPDEEADFELLVGKLSGFLERQVDGAVLLADDIEFETEVVVDGQLGQKHRDVANRLLEALREKQGDARLWFVPTVYSDERADGWPGGLDYLSALSSLHEDIGVLWTGLGTFNEELEAADLERFIGVVGRRPILWENYWANDAGDSLVGRVLLGSYEGRGDDLLESLDGLVVNPMIQGGLSRLTLTMTASWMRQGRAHQAHQARREAAMVERWFGYPEGSWETSSENLEFVLQLFAGNALFLPGHAWMEMKLEALHQALTEPQPLPQAGVDLLFLFARMAALESAVHHSRLGADVTDELTYPLRKVRLEGETGLWTLAALGQRLGGKSGEEFLALAQEAHGASEACRFLFSVEAISSLLDAVGDLAPQALGFQPVAGRSPADPCVAGEPWTWLPFDECSSTGVFGLPGAQVDASSGLVTWMVPHGGRFRAVAACAAPSGWGSVTADLVCR